MTDRGTTAGGERNPRYGFEEAGLHSSRGYRALRQHLDQVGAIVRGAGISARNIQHLNVSGARVLIVHHESDKSIALERAKRVTQAGSIHCGHGRTAATRAPVCR